MKKTSTAEISLLEIDEAVRAWLKARDVEVDGVINFRVQGVEDPDDWQARNALSYELTGASFKVLDK